MDELDSDLWLVCRVQARLCALPLQRVVETLRPLPIEPVAGGPSFVLGLAVIRGAPLPVVDAARLLGMQHECAERFVVVEVDGRRVALAVGGVLGVRTVPRGSLHALPPLLRDAGTEAIAAVGRLDEELLVVLHSARLLPEPMALAAEPLP